MMATGIITYHLSLQSPTFTYVLLVTNIVLLCLAGTAKYAFSSFFGALATATPLSSAVGDESTGA